MAKELFVLINDGEDGSYYPHYTFNREWIEEMQKKSDNRELCWPSIGCDGDGFHYDILTVPDECTLESLGILWDAAEDD